MRNLRPPRWTTFRIGPYLVSAKITPRRLPSHAGPDSPDYRNPGYPPSLESFRVFQGRVDVTYELGGVELERIRRQVCACAGIPTGEAEAPAPRLVPHIRERGQRYLDWRSP
jgi:hypothetical protein